MATEVEALIVRLEVSQNRFEKQLAAAARSAAKQANTIEARFAKMNQNINSSFGGIGLGFAASLASSLGVREIVRYADAWTTAGNKIAAASQLADRQGRSLDGIKQIANDTRSGLTETADLYAKLLRSTASVASSELEVARATEVVNKAFKAGGAATSEQIAGVLQLSQALGSAVLQGDELKTLRESAPIIAQAIATEFGTTVAGLKDLGTQGKLVTDRVFKAILKAAPEIGAAFDATKATIGDAFTQIDNELIAYIGNADTAAGASQKLVAALQFVADNFKGIADAAVELATILIGALTGRAIAGLITTTVQAVGAIGTLITALRLGTVAAISFNAALGPISLLVGAAAAAIILYSDSQTDAEAASAAHAVALKELSFQIDTVDYANAAAVESTRQKIDSDLGAAKAALARAQAERALAAAIVRDEVDPQMGLLPAPKPNDLQNTEDNAPMVKERQAVIDATLKQIADLEAAQGRFNDYASGRKQPPARQGDRPATPGVAGGGGSAKAPKAARAERDDSYEREVKQIQERTVALQAETAAQATVNPLIDDYGYAVTLASTKQDLLNAAQEANIKITPEVTANIQKLAEGYAAASVESEKLAESQNNAQKSAQEMADIAKDSLSGFISDMRNGVSATEALGNALSKLADKLLDSAFDMLFDFSGKGGNNLIGSFFSLFKAADGGIAKNGRQQSLPQFAKGGVSRSAAIFGEAGPEAAVPLPDGRRIPVDLKMPGKGSVRGGGGAQTFNIDARGAQKGVGDEIRAALASYDKQLDRALPGKIAKGRQMNRGRF